MKRLSIGVRLTLLYLVIFALGELVFGGGMWLILRHNVLDMVDDDLETQLDDLTRLLAAHNENESVAAVQQRFQEAYATKHSGDYLAVFDAGGALIYESAFFGSHPSTLLPAERVQKTTVMTRRIDHEPFRFLLARLKLGGRFYVVQMGIPADDAIDTIDLFRSYLLMFAPLLLLIGAAVGYWMSRRALAPVDALVRTARAVSGTNLSSRLEKLNTGDELQRLSDTLNEMLDRIETSFLRITQFTADASHELRTPVSLIRTEAELALRRARSEREYQESLRHILLQAERTTVLIEQLLSLARADSGQENLHMKPIDLSTLLDTVAEGWKQVAAMRDVRFCSNVHDPNSCVTGDESLLRRLADILLDNAFKYTQSPGSVSLSLEHRDQVVVVTVEDSGIGIPENEQEKIFERFYRVDKSRSRSQGSSGLGLSIAQWIVNQHHGSISVESHVGKGSKFRIELPKVARPMQNAQSA